MKYFSRSNYREHGDRTEADPWAVNRMNNKVAAGLVADPRKLRERLHRYVRRLWLVRPTQLCPYRKRCEQPRQFCFDVAIEWIGLLNQFGVLLQPLDEDRPQCLCVGDDQRQISRIAQIRDSCNLVYNAIVCPDTHRPDEVEAQRSGTFLYICKDFRPVHNAVLMGEVVPAPGVEPGTY